LAVANKLEILKLFKVEGPLTPTFLANLLDINPNNARQIILRLKRQGLIFHLTAFAGGQSYSLTGKGEARVIFLADEEEKERQTQRKEMVKKRKLTGMYLYMAIATGLPNEIEKRIVGQFNIPNGQLGSKRLGEIELPQHIREQTGLLKQSGEQTLSNIILPFNDWVRVLENISKPIPKPRHLSVEEVVIISSLTKKGSGQFFVTGGGEIIYAPGEGYLTLEAAAILSSHRKARMTR
jgi:hypothetical protein